MKRFKILCALAVAATALTVGTAQATTIQAAASGIAAPTTTIGFDEVALGTNDTVTTQFAPFGVTFDPGITYFTNVSARPNFAGAAAISFFGADFSIRFSETVSAMSAAMTANFGGMTMTALLDGVAVESFDHTFPFSSVTPVATNANNFFGFSDIRFNEVRVSLNGTTSGALDTLSFTQAPAPIPLPAGAALLLAGLGGLGLVASRRRRTA